MKRFYSCFKYAGNTRNNLQFFPASTRENATFPCFSLSKFWIPVSSKIFKQILADLFLITKRDQRTNMSGVIGKL